jgi:glutamyl-tRNA synthetase
MDTEQIIKKHALQNAVKFNGKANIGAVIGKLLAENPELKENLNKIKNQVNQVVNEVNNLSIDEQTAMLKKLCPTLLNEKKKEKRYDLPPLKNAIKGKVIMRFEPSPSGPLHIGHAYVLCLNSEYCRKYKGKLILRIGDTNPGNIYVASYKLIPEDANWVTKNNISKVIIQSNRLKIYYKYIEKLIKLRKAYVCTCDPLKFKELILKQIPCICRKMGGQEQRWKKMFTKYEPGEAVVRIKTEINHKNPALRDWPAFRINDKSHPKTGKRYRVWPLMNFSVVVDDIEMNVTHIIRAKDHADNARRQEYIYKYLNKPIPEALFVGRINFIGMVLSTTATKEMIKEGKYDGWDDIRLPFLLALKRRGYQPETFIRYALEVGMSLNDKTVSKEEFFKSINAFNKEIIDKKANRYFFIEEPIKIKIENAPKQTLKLDLHPDFPKRGKRIFKIHNHFYINKNDYRQIKDNKLYRLMDCLNFVKKGNKFIFDSLDYKKYKEKGDKIIHWLPEDKSLIKVEILMHDKKLIKGLAEPMVNKLKKGDIIQFVRFGFCRLDNKRENKLIFWNTHE